MENGAKEMIQEKKIINNLNELRSLLIEISAAMHDYEGGMNRIDSDDNLRQELDRSEETKKQKDWDSMNLSEKIWFNKEQAAKVLNYLHQLNKRFNSLV